MKNSHWVKLSEPLDLSNYYIHVWLLDIAKISKSFNFENLLSSDESEKRIKYHFEKDRIVYSTTRGVLRHLLSSYLKIPNKELVFEDNEYGKPFLNKNINSELKFNVSHSKGFALIALNLNDEVGVDLEFINEEFITKDVVRKYFSNYECKEYFNLPVEKQLRSFFNIWTRKEAYIKAEGKGLSIPLDSFDVTILDEPVKLLRTNEATKQNSIFLNNLEINSHYCAAVLNIGNKKEILKFDFSPS